MQLPPFEYIRPKSLAEGLAVLAEQGDRIKLLSGGSDLLINMKFRLDTPEYLLSLNGLPELQNVEQRSDGSVRIGAGCKLTELANNELVKQHFPALHAAIFSVGSRHVRNIGTIGGNICLETRCWYTNQSENWRETRDGCFKTDQQLCHVIKTAKKCHAISSTDTGPVLMALGATAVLASTAGEREVSMLDFYQDDGIEHTVVQPGEILVAVILAAPSGRSIFAKLSQREGLDFAAGTLAAWVDGGNEQPKAVRLVMGSVAPQPKLMTQSAQILLDQGLNDDAIDGAALAARSALNEVTNLFTPSGFKRRLVRSLVKDALLELRAQPGAF